MILGCGRIGGFIMQVFDCECTGRCNVSQVNISYFCSHCCQSPPFCSFVMQLDVLNVVYLEAKMLLVYILNENTSYVYYSWSHLISSHNVLVNGDDSL
jgi:hypothetical protein